MVEPFYISGPFSIIVPKDIDENNYITFGAVNFSYEITDAIREFNQTNDEYQIKTIDYAKLYPDDPYIQNRVTTYLNENS